MRMRTTVSPQATLADRPRQKLEAVSQNLANRCPLSTAGLILSRASMSPAPSGLKPSRLNCAVSPDGFDNQASRFAGLDCRQDGTKGNYVLYPSGEAP